MIRFHLEQSGNELYTSHTGLALVGRCINTYTSLAARVCRVAGRGGSIAHADVLRSYVGLLCQGKSDFEAITGQREDRYFKDSLGIETAVPSTETLRQRMDNHAEPFRRVIDSCTVEMIGKSGAKASSLPSGHVPLDIDVFTMDNSNTKKEGVCRTYRTYHGYAPIAAYLGLEGWCLEVELRPGSQHSQKDFVPFLDRVIDKARQVTKKPILVRLDSGHDALETRVALRRHKRISFIVKWNPRREDLTSLQTLAFAEGRVDTPRDGKRVALTTICEKQVHEGKTYLFTRVLRVTERTVDKHGQYLLTPEVEVEGWWTNLHQPEEQVIRLYEGHGLMEQFHSEFKTDLDIERLPSGKFATNALVMSLATLAYNILRFIGQAGLMGDISPVRHPAKRRRLKTVIQELITLAARVVRKARRVILRFGRHCPGFEAFRLVYDRLLPA